MSLRILDTDHVSLFQRGHPQITNRLAKVASTELSITIITLEEQLRGRFQMTRRASSPSELIFAYQNLHVTFDSLKSFRILDFSPAAQGHFILDLGDEFRWFQPSKTKISDAWNGAFS